MRVTFQPRNFLLVNIFEFVWPSWTQYKINEEKFLWLDFKFEILSTKNKCLHLKGCRMNSQTWDDILWLGPYYGS